MRSPHTRESGGPQKNDLIELKITGITNEGNGVGHDQGMAVFVPDAAAGDLLEVRLVKLMGRFSYGRIERIVSPSPDRIKPDCPVSRRCGGCSLRHISYEAEKREKQRQVGDAFERIGGFSDQTLLRGMISADQIDGYRNKAMLPIRRENGAVRIGFYASRTHDIIEAQACRLHPEEFSAISETVRRYIEESGASCYEEKEASGLIRHLYIRKAFATGQIMVCLVVNGRKLPDSGRLLSGLDTLSLPITSVVLNENTRNTNVILGERTQLLAGSPSIEDILCGVRVRLHPRSFYQVNHDGAELLYRKAAEYADLTGSETLIDLYCGAGTIGLSMAGRTGRLIGVEVVDKAVEDARVNARINGVQNAQFICADASEAAARFVKENISPDVVVVDPPRKGCAAAVLESIAQMNPSRVVMISCNPATAARDCKMLAGLGYVPREITPVDLFPRTCHTECVIKLCRA